jgi:hypothetical protein
MSIDLIYTYLFDIGWFFLITCALMVTSAGLIVFMEDLRGKAARASKPGPSYPTA